MQGDTKQNNKVQNSVTFIPQFNDQIANEFSANPNYADQDIMQKVNNYYKILKILTQNLLLIQMFIIQQ